MGEVALDGWRLQGDAALEKTRTLEQIVEDIQAILDEAAEINAEEDDEYCPDKRGDELPEELQYKESRLKQLREPKAKFGEKELVDEQTELFVATSKDRKFRKELRERESLSGQISDSAGGRADKTEITNESREVCVYPESSTAGTALAREIISLSRTTRLSSS